MDYLFRKYLSFAFLCLCFISCIAAAANNSNSVIQPFRGNFLYGAAGDYKDYNFQFINSELGFNLWHNYVDAVLVNNMHYPEGWTFVSPNDHLYSNVSEYQSSIVPLLNTIGSHNMNAWMQRPKIDFLVYGQRSDYKCVDVKYVDPDLWFYTFQSPAHVGTDIKDISSFGNGNYVRYCRAKNSYQPKIHDASGFVVSRLKTNAEQCHRSNGFDAYRWDSEHLWYIKPKVRIDTMFCRLNPEANVFTISVIGQDGETVLKEVTVKCKNFLDSAGSYDGRYIERFQDLDDKDSLIIQGDWGDQWLFSARGNKPTDTDNNKVDIRIFWHGECDMWIEQVRVDNDIAHDLLSEDPSNTNYRTYMTWLQGEAQNIACSGTGSYKFYMELMEFNQIPCVKFVNEKLKQFCSRGIDLVIASVFYQYHMSWEDRGKILKPDQITRQFVNKVGLTELLYGHLPFTSIENRLQTYSKVPNTLNIFDTSKILAKIENPNEYEVWLQANLDTISDVDEGTSFFDKSKLINYLEGKDPCPQMPQFEGKFRFDLQLANGISKNSNVPFISWVQITQWFAHCSEIEREPTNEELDMIVNIPIAYGAKGLIFFEYSGWQNGNDYNYAITETDGFTPRQFNVYNQPKWEKMLEIKDRLQNWGRFIKNFDNTKTNTYIYRLQGQRASLFRESYFNSARTYLSETLSNNGFRDGTLLMTDKQGSDKSYDEVSRTYLQLSTFEELATGNLYFMVVNKRCSPYIDGKSIDRIGGLRNVEVLFKKNHVLMSGFTKWKIEDVADTNSTGIILDKLQGSYVSLGNFNPGEGKIFKLSPLSNSAPANFVLSQNYPNPFNPETQIDFSLPVNGKVSIKIFDVNGRLVKELMNEFRNAGYYSITFNASNLSSGIYFYKIEAAGFTDTKKMAFVK